MKKRNMIKLIPLISLLVIGFFGLSVSAAPPSSSDKYFTSYPDIRIVDQTTNLTDDGSSISGAYSTTLRLTDEVFYSFKGTTDDIGNNKNYAQNQDAGTLKFDKSKMGTTPKESSSVRLTNIAIFQGEYVDLRISMGAKYPNEGGYIYLDVPAYNSTAAKKKEFLFFENKGGGKKDSEFYYKYEFLKAGTEETVKDYKGMWNFRRVNDYKSVTVDKSMSHQMYVYNDTKLKYNETPSEVTVYGTVGKEYDNVAFTNLFDLPDGTFYTNTVNLKNYHNRLKYDLEPITKMELGYPQIIGDYTEDSNSREVGYRVIQDMPAQSKPNFYPSSYTLTVQMDPEFDVTTASYSVIDVDNKDTTSDFKLLQRDTVNNRLVFYVDSNRLSANDFVDNSHRISIKGQLKPSFEKNKSKYYDQNTGYYKIPASVHYQTNDNQSETNSATAKLKAGLSAKPINQTVSQGDNSSDWKNKPIDTLFTDMYGAYEGDELVIDSVENKVFKDKGATTVSVTLKGSKSGLTKTISVPVNVLEQRKAKIYYLDEKGKEILTPVSKSGFETQKYDYSSEIKEIPNYKFVKVDETKGDAIKGTFTSGKDVNIYLSYELDEQTVTTNYVDEEGKPIEKPVKKDYAPNSEQTLSSVTVPGYEASSVKVDNVEKTLTPDGKVKVSVTNKPMSVTFVYKSIHYSLKMNVSKQSVSQMDELTYTLNVKSGMVYPENKVPEDYTNLSLTIPIDPNLIISPDDIKVLNSKDQTIGVGQYDQDSKELKLTLSESVKNTEDIKVIYKALVKETAATDTIIEAQASMKASYQVNGQTVEINKKSNVARSTIAGGLRLVSAPDTIDFGKMTYMAKATSIDNPSIDDRLVVSDTRSNSEDGWQLNVALVVPLTKTTGEVLDGEVIYKNGKDEHELTSAEYPIYTKKATDQANVDVTDSWGTTAKSDGIKLKFKATDAPKTGSYTGKIRWTLMAGQP